MEGEKQDESGIIPRLLAPFVERLKGRPLLGQLIWDIALRCQIREDASPESIAGGGGTNYGYYSSSVYLLAAHILGVPNAKEKKIPIC